MRWIKKLLGCEHGSALPIVGLGILALVGATGAAIDLGRIQIVQSRLQTSLDNAGLAAASSALTVTPSTQALNYFNANYPANYMGSTVHDFTVTESSDTITFNLSVKADVPPTFMQIFGVGKVTVSAQTQIIRQTNGMELVLTLDNTGSMAQSAGGSVSKLQAAQSAATTLLNILYGSNNTSPNLWVGIVPFSQAVNVGTSRTAWLDSTYDATLNFGPIANTTAKTCTSYVSGSGVTTAGTYSTGPSCYYKVVPPTTPITYATFGQINWQGCVESRSNGTATPAYDITDDPPSVKPFRMYYYPNDSNDNWYSTGNSQTCTGGQCLSSYTGTCTTNYPACCPANAESCTNPANCGKSPTTASCTICSQYASSTCTVTSNNTNYNYSLSTWLGTNLGPNAFCPEPLQPLVAEKSTLITEINNMKPVGETAIDLGLAWAWRMLSPRWQGLWGGEMNTNNLPMAYHTPHMSKVVILMTDGDNNIVSGYYSAYGYPTANQLGPNACTGTNCAQGISVINSRTSNGSTGVCDLMKAQGIIIYTVALGTLIDQTAQNMLQQCASNPNYFFLSPTTNELQGIFQQIGDSLANLRVSQ